MKEFLINVVRGAIIGIANIIPGVSGGTMAVSLGIYDKLVKIIGNIIESVFKDFKNTFKFMFPIVIGAGVGVLLFSRIIEYCLGKFEMQTIFLFFGLILGTIPLIFKNANKQGFNKKYTIPGIITFIFMISLLFVKKSNDVVFNMDAISMIMLFIYGIIAAGTMIIPGISGSFVLMLLGVYLPILALVNNLQIVFLIPFGIGVVVGILLFSKLIDFLLNKFYGYTYYTIIGFILGSLPLIFKDITWINSNILISVILCITGTTISYIFSKKTE